MGYNRDPLLFGVSRKGLSGHSYAVMGLRVLFSAGACMGSGT